MAKNQSHKVMSVRNTSYQQVQDLYELCSDGRSLQEFSDIRSPNLGTAFFLGSVKSAKRFARLISLVQSAKNCKRNVQKYFHDNLNRVMVTAKEDLASILPHKWVEPVTIPLVY